MTVRFKRTRARRPCLKAIRTIVVEAAKDNRWGHRDSRRLEREAAESPFVFVSERGAPFSIRGLQAMVERVAQAAGFDIKTHPHMLRHACGYKLAMRVSIRARSRAIWVTSRSSIRCAIPNWRPLGLGPLARLRWK